MRWSRVGWPAVGYVSLEDVDGYADHLARLLTDAPPTVAALASVTWSDARIEAWQVETSDGRAAAEPNHAPDAVLHAAFVVRNDEVLDTPDGLWRRWNHARVRLRAERVALEPSDTDDLGLLAGDVHVSRGEIAHVEADVWELRLLLSPTGELAVRFRDVAVDVAPVGEQVWADLGSRPAHGWHGPVPDGWVEWATPAVRAAAHGDVGGLSLALDGVGTAPEDIDALDPRWGLAPLHAAAWFDRRGTTEALLERGADVTLRDAEGRTALDLARDRGSTTAAALLGPLTGGDTPPDRHATNESTEG